MHFFERTSQGRYQLVRDATGQPLFAKPQLSRSIALADFNRDHRPDMVVTHLFDPVSLFINHTQPRQTSDKEALSLHHDAHYIQIRLVGTRSQRDVVGAVVDITFNDASSSVAQDQQNPQAARRLRRIVTAGDGYQCSNERVLTFGLGTAQSINQLRVTWPDGSHSSVENLAPDSEWLWIEGDAKPWNINQ